MLAPVKTTIRHKLECSCWYELREQCEPMIEHHLSDLLKIDRSMILEHWGVPYLHWTRECGTYIQFLHSHNSPVFPPKGTRTAYIFGTADRDHVLRAISVVAECERRAGSKRLVHYFDGTTLKVIDADKAIELAHKHVRMVRYAWANGDK